MGTMLSRCPLELGQRFALFKLPIAIFVHQPIEPRTIWPLASDIHIAVEGQQTLNILNQIAIRLGRIWNAIAIGVVHQNEPTTLDRSDDVSEFIESHRDQ